MDERIEEIVAMWNTYPYPTQAVIGKTVGVTRQRVEQILAAARVAGLVVLDAPERTLLRLRAKVEARTALRPRCSVCRKLLTKRVVANAAGEFFCPLHRRAADAPHRAYHRAYQRAYQRVLRRAARVPTLKRAIIGEIIDRRLVVDPQEFVDSLFRRLSEMPLRESGGE